MCIVNGESIVILNRTQKRIEQYFNRSDWPRVYWGKLDRPAAVLEFSQVTPRGVWSSIAYKSAYIKKRVCMKKVKIIYRILLRRKRRIWISGNMQ